MNALRVGLVVSEVVSRSEENNGRYPERAVKALIAAGEVDMVAFPENFRQAATQGGVTEVARSLADELGVPVLTGVLCEDERMQCAGYWNPSPSRGETRQHFYAKHATSVRLAYELANYKAIRDDMFTPIRLNGRNIGVQLCHDMFFGLVSAHWKMRGADVLFDLTGSNVNLSKWTNVAAARSLEHDVPFLCTMGHWRFMKSNSARSFAYRSGRALRSVKTAGSAKDGRVTVFDIGGPLDEVAAGSDDQEFTEQRYSNIRVALNAPGASADIHVGRDGTVDGKPSAKAPGWRAFKIKGEEVGVLPLKLAQLKDALSIHRAEVRESPFAHHIVAYVGNDDDLEPGAALALAKLRAIEHRMAIAILTPKTREMIKTNRYKNIQLFHHEGGVFGLDPMFLRGTYGYVPESGTQNIRREFIDDYRALRP